MAENNNNNQSETTLVEYSKNNNNTNTLKKKFEKFKSKLVELFSSSSATTNASALPISTSTTVSSQALGLDATNEHLKQSLNDSSDFSYATSNRINLLEPFNNTISSYYYGYTTIYIGDNNNNINREPLSTQKKQNKLSQKKSTTKLKNSINKYNSSAELILSSSTSSASSSSSIINEETKDSNSNTNTNNNNSRMNSSKLNSNTYNPNNGELSLQTNMMMESTIGYDSTSLYTNNFDVNSNHLCLMTTSAQSNCGDSSIDCQISANPFLNEEHTSKISFNADLAELNALFESSLYLIDEQDNFFDINFMTNYISYVLLKRIRDDSQASLLSQFNFDLKSSDNVELEVNLLKEIARKIYLESESEPCGLKGCKLAIFLDVDNSCLEQTQSQQQQQQQSFAESQTRTKFLLNSFKFDPTSSLTTFELNLTLSHDNTIALESNPTGGSNNNTNNGREATTTATESSQQSYSTISTLTRKLLSRTMSSSNKSNMLKVNLDDATRFKYIYLDSFNYELSKLKLY